MILFPPAKINLGLDIKSKRSDGYHEIETCMYPIPLTDVLEILPSKEFSFVQTGLTVEGSVEDNLCVKAYQLLQNQFNLPSVYMHLRKNIPMGAGLGGGSSDATYVLKGLNQLFDLNLTIAQLEAFSAQLGSDCPFFVRNEPQIATGRGEILTPTKIDVNGLYLYLVNPGIHVGTSEAYDGVSFSSAKKALNERIAKPVFSWKETLQNDFEPSIFSKKKEIATLKYKMYQQGAIYASMSGSGSSVFGIFESQPLASHPMHFEFITQFS